VTKKICKLMFDFDPLEFEFPCPICDFYNSLTFGEARVGVPIICRGCKNTLRPDDAMSDLENARRTISDSIRELQEKLERSGR